MNSQPSPRSELKQSCKPEQHQPFEGHDTQGQSENDGEIAEQDAEIDAGPHGDEEQAEQQALEGLDVGLELVSELAVGQYHAGQKGAQRR